MFQYAAAYALALRNTDEVVIDTSSFNDRSKPDEIFTHRSLELDNVFNLKLRHDPSLEKSRYRGASGMNGIFNALMKIWVRKIRRSVLRENRHGICNDIKTAIGDVYLVGGWQTEKYFEGYEDQVRLLYSFRDTILEESGKLLHNIKDEDSVCLHVRRGDYVTSPMYSKSIGALSKDYYYNAAMKIREAIPDPSFYIFSNDLEWCRSNLLDIGKVTIVGEKHIGNNCANYMQLMTMCKHFIISNSTFSWWAAWLGEMENSIIIAPSNWTRSGMILSDKIVPERWLKSFNSFASLPESGSELELPKYTV